jgi:3-deoxy-D-manno-octulosonate 8-phosphate phosphatase (KDO 8-P phosphatase)
MRAVFVNRVGDPSPSSRLTAPQPHAGSEPLYEPEPHINNPTTQQPNNQFATLRRMAAVDDIRVIVSDVDGVWTDGRIIYTSEGGEIKEFNVRDGLGVKLVQRAGIVVALLTSRRSTALDKRARELGITDIVQGAANKLAELQKLAGRLAVSLDQVLYAGDDLPDLAPMKRVAISAAPSDAAQEVHEAATWKLRTPGGRGAFRELVERLLRERGVWEAVVGEFASDKSDSASV